MRSLLKILILGYGNPGREDDGLGPALIDNLDKLNIPNLTLDSDYQLNIEYAEEISKYDTVIFIDASLNSDSPFEFYPLQPKFEASISTHSMSAENVLGLCQKLYKKTPDAYMCAIRGHSFELKEGLTDSARDNMTLALNHLVTFVQQLSK